MEKNYKSVFLFLIRIFLCVIMPINSFQWSFGNIYIIFVYIENEHLK